MIHIIDYINTDARHMDHWRTVVPQALIDAGHEVNVISGTDEHLAASEWNLLGEMFYKTTQFATLHDEIVTGGISRGDILIIGDAWNPTIISLKYIQLIMNLDVVVIGMWRDGLFDLNSKIRTGLLRKPKHWARSFERALYKAYDYNCFITDSQHKRFMNRYRYNETSESLVTGLPYQKLIELRSQYSVVDKENIIVLPHDSADSDQRKIFGALKNYLTDFTFIDCYELQLSSSEYYSILNRAKAVMAINLSETDPTNIYEAMLFGCVPIIPDALIYSDIFPEQYWYPTHYTQPPFMNFVRGREYMHRHIKDVMENYDQLKPEKSVVDAIGNTYFNNDGLLQLVNKIKKDYATKPRKRVRPQRKFKRSRNN
jgi:hypothetical protein